MPNRKEDHRKAYAKPEVKEYHKKWIRQYWKNFGCTSLSQFTSIIECKFKPGMTWKNFGLNGWVMDHIRPCASFDLRIFEEQKVCFHHSNLQPEWNMDNVHKSSRWNGKIWKKSDHQKESTANA